MNIAIMMDAFVTELKKATSHLQMQDPKGNFNAPQVFNGYMPPKNPRDPQAVDDFPYVIARYLNDETEESGDPTAQVKVYCGTYSEDEQGWCDLLNLSDTIKTHFLSQPFFGKCFEVILPLKREFPEEQPKPEWVGWFTFTISIPNIIGANKEVERIINGSD